MDDSVFDMEEIDVQVGFEDEEEADRDANEFGSPKNRPEDTSKSSCYQSASSDCSWATSRDVSPVRPGKPTGAILEQLDMKPMQDFRDYVNFTPSMPSKLFLQTSVGNSTSTGSTSGGSIGGLSPNSSDSGLGTSLRPNNKLFVSQPVATNDISSSSTKPDTSSSSKLMSSIKTDDTLLFGGGMAPRYRSSIAKHSICYARSASCDSLF